MQGGGKEGRPKTTRDERKKRAEEMGEDEFCPHCFRSGSDWHDAANCHRGGPKTPQPQDFHWKPGSGCFWGKEEGRDYMRDGIRDSLIDHDDNRRWGQLSPADGDRALAESEWFWLQKTPGAKTGTKEASGQTNGGG